MGEMLTINHYTEAWCKQCVMERDQMSQCLIYLHTALSDRPLPSR